MDHSTLLFCARKWTDGYSKLDWHTLNLETGEISDTLITMPPEIGIGFSVVVCRNHVYLLGGGCSMDPNCPNGETNKIHRHDYVFFFDSDHPDHGWKEGPRMSDPRWRPAIVATEGKIYVFMGSALGYFGDVFDVSENCWKLLFPPSDVDLNLLRLSRPVLYDSPRSRILLHFKTHDFRGKYPLYAYYHDSESWECLNENFSSWPNEAVLVDGVLYCLLCPDTDMGMYCFSDQSCSLHAYDVIENKWLPINWLSEFPVYVPDCSDIYHLGNGRFCLTWYNSLRNYFQYTKINLQNNSGEIHATGLSEFITVPFQDATCEFTCLK